MLAMEQLGREDQSVERAKELVWGLWKEQHSMRIAAVSRGKLQV